MPPLVEEEGIRFVSTSGPFKVGSGKSGTPFSRTHWANLRRAVNCCGVKTYATYFVLLNSSLTSVQLIKENLADSA